MNRIDCTTHIWAGFGAVVFLFSASECELPFCQANGHSQQISNVNHVKSAYCQRNAILSTVRPFSPTNNTFHCTEHTVYSRIKCTYILCFMLTLHLFYHEMAKIKRTLPQYIELKVSSLSLGSNFGLLLLLYVCTNCVDLYM